MKLYTGAGDGGETSLLDGTRVPKDALRVSAYGDVDELNAMLGWCRATIGAGPMADQLVQVQQELLAIGAELASPSPSNAAERVGTIDERAWRRLERWIDEASARVEPLQNLIVPGGTEHACRLHIARACCRRVERTVVALSRKEKVRTDTTCYLNRLSDLMFAWARQVNHEAGVPDLIWAPSK